MIWEYKTRRCIRRFAVLPRRVYFRDTMTTKVFWLQYYYVFQDRVQGLWFDDVGCSRETWLRWKGKL